MIVIPAGSVVLPARQPGGVPRRVTIDAQLAVGKYDVTRDEFAAFVTATGYKADGCYTYDGGRLPGALFHNDASANWRHVGFEQSGRDPVVCVNWFDATAYAQWLSQKTGHHYRLLTDVEWEYAARGGLTMPFKATSEDGNFGTDPGCCRPFAKGRDQWEYTSPVGSFAANQFALYDMLGNVEQWVEDCRIKRPSPESVPPGSSSTERAACVERAIRGSSWAMPPANGVGSGSGDPTTRESSIGFRVARTP